MPVRRLRSYREQDSMGGIAAPSWLDKPVNEQTLPLSTRREE